MMENNNIETQPQVKKSTPVGRVYRMLEIVVGILFTLAGMFLFSTSLIMSFVCGIVAGLMFWGRKLGHH